MARTGGKYRAANGYILIHNPKHPMAAKSGYLMEHRLIMSEHLGRLLLKREVVHHINGKRDDNRIENLQLMTKREHDRLPKPPPKPIQCPYCAGMIAVSGRVRHVAPL